MMDTQILKSLRTEKKLSQREVAQMLGIDRTSYTKYESGLSDPPANKLCLLADIFGVSADLLLGRQTLPLAGDHGFGVFVRIPEEALGDLQKAIELLQSFSTRLSGNAFRVEAETSEEIDPAAAGRALLESFREQVPDLDKYRVPDPPPARGHDEGGKQA